MYYSSITQIFKLRERILHGARADNSVESTTEMQS